MKTDPARARRKDPGNPDNCPVFALHQLYSPKDLLAWSSEGCRSASIGCLDCKKPLIDAVNAEQAQMRERARQFEEDPDLVSSILQEGSEAARAVARETLEDVREAIGLA
jgi:tryptophanyl-tRNA synthetase